jgi:uncharacterized membrane protein YdjX (TVP38/TMEM64 family)
MYAAPARCPTSLQCISLTLIHPYVSKHDRIVLAIRPVADKIVNTPGAWAVPVAALIVVSIPPLIGHEIIILVVGVLWGLWWGFAIAVAGTFIGEILTCKHLFVYHNLQTAS